MLRRNHHGIDANRATVFIHNGNLGLAIRTQERKCSIPTRFCQSLGQAMGEHDGHRHQFTGLITGITEHHALITGALLLE